MLLRALFIISAASAVYCHEAWIKTAPKNVRLESGTPVAKNGDFLQLIESVLGLSTEKCSFDGVRVTSPFGAASSLAVLSVETNDDLFQDTPGAHFPITQELALVDITSTLVNTLAAKFASDDNVQKATVEPYDATEKPYQLRSLQDSAFPDSSFLAELQMLLRLPAQVEAASFSATGPPVHMAAVHSLPLLELTYGKHAAATEEAKRLLIETVNVVERELAAQGSTLVVVTGDEKAIRHKRQAPSSSPDSDPSFGPVFQIMLWLSIVFAFVLLYIAVGIGTMDPGRDSIIYRMTNTRMKKDN